jgi:predicted phage baseplate assembly protein
MKGPISSAANALLSFQTSPYIGASDELVIPFSNRVISISSPEDGASLSFTLYKLVNGLVDLLNSDASIILREAEGIGAESGNPGVVTAHDNLVLLEGALARKTGTFGANAGVKLVNLEGSPVVEGSVQVYIQGSPSTSGVYTQVDNIYFASGASSKVFQVISDDDFRATVVFGDGLIGVSPAPGDEYTIVYRVGGGARGNINAEVINVPTNLVNITQGYSQVNGTLENSTKATGGSDAETVEHAKRYGPLSFRRQDRVVTLHDFISFANSFISSYGSIGKAVASTRRAYSSANIIDLYILEKASDIQLRKATPTFKKEMLDAIEPKKMLTDEVIIVDGLIRTIDLIITARIDREVKSNEETIKLKIRDAVLSYFNVDNRLFGQEMNPQEVAREIFNIPEVRYATVDNFPETVKVDFNEIIQLNNLTINLVRV